VVGDCGSVFTGSFGNLFVVEPEFKYQSLVGFGYFEGVEVFSLDVLDQGDFEEVVISDVGEDDWHFGKASELGSAETSFAGHQLDGSVHVPNDEGLNDAVGADGLTKFVEGLLVKYGSWLKRVWFNLGDCQALGSRIDRE
jgi:hypothetical protein